MQVVDVLGDEERLAPARCQAHLEAGQGAMRAVRLGREEVAAAGVVEGLHGIGIGCERLRGGELHGIEPRPDARPGLVAEGAETALGGRPCTRQTNNPHRPASASRVGGEDRRLGGRAALHRVA
jgi:hypothetical protein